MSDRWEEKAREWTEQMFTNGSGRKASRLMLVEDDLDGHIDLGGWGREPFADKLAVLLRSVVAEARREEAEKWRAVVDGIAGEGSDGKPCWCYAGTRNEQHDDGCREMRRTWVVDVIVQAAEEAKR